ncbi:endoribonuclease Dcr-1 [Oopsacas minuta]|uniref:Endoribonuclease Dcr-1 n=1 Tax=Oopsacas minuta TaxID=111878 RepID=A0AAV7JKR1_9METZ|nr:endoribonuclease Dcr-1 [Oopsacas minuta]
MIPSALSKPVNISDKNYIYIFIIVLQESGADYWGQESNERYEKVKPNNYIGIITAEKVPYKEIPTFEVFYHGLNLKVTIKPIQTKTPLERVHSEILKFQHSVFLEVWSYNDKGRNFEFSPDQANNRSFLICPLKQLQNEKWDFDLESLNNFTSKAVLNSLEDEFYVQRVVSPPNTHPNPNQYYHIIRMIPEVTLNSEFPDERYSTYSDHLTSKYGLVFVKEDYSRSALEGIHVSGHYNLTTSRHKTPQGKDLPKRDYDNKRHKTYFFSPHLKAHPIPSTLWRLCVMLPSIVYRVERFILMLEFSNSVDTYVTSPVTATGNDIDTGIVKRVTDTPAHLNYDTIPELCVNSCGDRPNIISLLSAFTGLFMLIIIHTHSHNFSYSRNMLHIVFSNL